MREKVLKVFLNATSKPFLGGFKSFTRNILAFGIALRLKFDLILFDYLEKNRVNLGDVKFMMHEEHYWLLDWDWIDTIDYIKFAWNVFHVDIATNVDTKSSLRTNMTPNDPSIGIVMRCNIVVIRVSALAVSCFVCHSKRVNSSSSQQQRVLIWITNPMTHINCATHFLMFFNEAG